MDAFKQIRIIFFALIAGQLIYFFVALILVGNNSFAVDEDYENLPGFLALLIIVSLVISSKYLYRRLISAQTGNSTLDEKINSYRTNNIIKFALLEGANLISITFYLLTGDFLYLAMFIIVLALNFIYFPGKEKFMMDFELTPEDMEKMNKF